jgi:quercetin dioxygenase-like cupin family protein
MFTINSDYHKENEMPGDALAIAPHLYKVVLENEQVRVLEVKASPGVASEMHSHPSYVAIAITDSQMKFTLPDGKSIEVEIKAGQSRFSGPLDHATEIAGNHDAHLLLVELK